MIAKTMMVHQGETPEPGTLHYSDHMCEIAFWGSGSCPSMSAMKVCADGTYMTFQEAVLAEKLGSIFLSVSSNTSAYSYNTLPVYTGAATNAPRSSNQYMYFWFLPGVSYTGIQATSSMAKSGFFACCLVDGLGVACDELSTLDDADTYNQTAGGYTGKIHYYNDVSDSFDYRTTEYGGTHCFGGADSYSSTAYGNCQPWHNAVGCQSANGNGAGMQNISDWTAHYSFTDLLNGTGDGQLRGNSSGTCYGQYYFRTLVSGVNTLSFNTTVYFSS